MDKKEEKSKKDKIINIIYYTELVILVLLVLAYVSNYIYFGNWQRIKVQYYLKTERINDLSIDECIEIFGEPIYVYNDNSMEFDGGYLCSGGFLVRYYEYILCVDFKEDGTGVEYADTDMIYERIY